MFLFNKKHKIGDTIAKLRKEKGWTQAELAEKLQVSDKAVSKWESNKGEPSIEFLPILADLFDVSLDYLMIGKEKEEKVIAISRLELCAKKDDVELYKELKLPLNYKDENGKTIFDYVFQYESKEVFKFLLNSVNFEHYLNGHNPDFYESLYYMRVKCWDMKVSRDLIRLDYEKSTINHHLGEYEKHIGYNGSQYVHVPRKIISDRIIDMILYDNKINQSIKEAMLTNHHERNFYSPAFAYPYLVHYVVCKEDFKLAKELLEKAVELNLKSKSIEYYQGRYIGFVDISKETFLKLLELEKYDLIELANQCNKIYKEKFSNNSLYKNDAFVLSNDEIEANKIKHDKKLSQKEKDLMLCLHDDILNIDELLATKGYKLIKESIFKHPTSYIEVFYTLLQKKNYRELFRLAVDMDIDSTSIRNQQLDKFSELVVKVFWTNYKPAMQSWEKRKVDEFKKRQEPNMKYFQEQKQGFHGLLNIGRTNLKIEDCMQKIKEGKDKILEDLSFEQEKNKITKNLTKDYFLSELEKGNIDRVVINLCVKLEAILKYQYKLEGDFQEMLDKFSGKAGDTNMTTLFNKLRMFRNKIVHAVAADIDISKDELKKCIEYICKLDDKE